MRCLTESRSRPTRGSHRTTESGGWDQTATAAGTNWPRRPAPDVRGPVPARGLFPKVCPSEIGAALVIVLLLFSPVFIARFVLFTVSTVLTLFDAKRLLQAGD